MEKPYYITVTPDRVTPLERVRLDFEKLVESSHCPDNPLVMAGLVNRAIANNAKDLIAPRNRFWELGAELTATYEPGFMRKKQAD